MRDKPNTDAMKLHDHVIHGTFVSDNTIIHNNPAGAFAVMGIAMAAKSATRIDVSNVFAQLMDDEVNNSRIDLRSITGAFPPWRVVWVEAKMPLAETKVPRVACLVTEMDADESSAFVASWGDNWAEEYRWEMIPREGETAFVSFTWIWHIGYGRACGPESMSMVVLNSEGAIAETLGGKPRMVSAVFEPEPQEVYSEWIEAMSWRMPLDTFRFANCKNVERVEQVPTRPMVRQAKRNGDPYVYYVLAIDPFANQKRYATGEKPLVPLERRMHICRGHVARYTEDAPLFGKYSGQFWIPAHVRGKEKVGFVEKDYEFVGEK